MRSCRGAGAPPANNGRGGNGKSSYKFVIRWFACRLLMPVFCKSATKLKGQSHPLRMNICCSTCQVGVSFLYNSISLPGKRKTKITRRIRYYSHRVYISTVSNRYLVAITPLISKQVVWVAMVDLAGAAIALGWNQLPPFLINAEIEEAMVDVLNVEKGVTRDSQEKVRKSSMCI